MLEFGVRGGTVDHSRARESGVAAPARGRFSRVRGNIDDRHLPLVGSSSVHRCAGPEGIPDVRSGVTRRRAHRCRRRRETARPRLHDPMHALAGGDPRIVARDRLFQLSNVPCRGILNQPPPFGEPLRKAPDAQTGDTNADSFLRLGQTRRGGRCRLRTDLACRHPSRQVREGFRGTNRTLQFFVKLFAVEA